MRMRKFPKHIQDKIDLAKNFYNGGALFFAASHLMWAAESMKEMAQDDYEMSQEMGEE